MDRNEYVKRRSRDLLRGDSPFGSPSNNAAAAGRRRRQRLNDAAPAAGAAGGGGAPRDAQMASRDAALEIMVEQVKTVLPQVQWHDRNELGPVCL